MKPSKRNIKIIAAVSLALLWSVSIVAGGCDSGKTIEPIPEVNIDDIIGGQHATSEKLNLTGALIVDDFGELIPFCSGSLISEETVVSARHCVEVVDWGYEDIYFAVGPDATAPDDLIAVAAIDTAPVDEGGFMALGQDVSVLQLDRPATGVGLFATPVSSDGLQKNDSMVTIGYGAFTASNYYDDQRRIGRETVVASEGRAFEAMFGDFESFVEWAITGDTTPENILELVDEETLEYLTEVYDSELLLPGNETVTGTAESDTQTCYGDSGGPLMKYVSGVGFQIYGVVSGGLSSNRAACDYGTVFATFTPDVIDFLEDARTWEDPCGDVGEAGMCDGNIAVNCVTDLGDGIRTLESEDCDAIGETCVMNGEGAFCGMPVVEEAEAPDEKRMDIRDIIFEAYFH